MPSANQLYYTFGKRENLIYVNNIFFIGEPPSATNGHVIYLLRSSLLWCTYFLGRDDDDDDYDNIVFSFYIAASLFHSLLVWLGSVHTTFVY